MLVRCLQTKGLFAIYCEISPFIIKSGIVIVNEGFKAGEYELVESDNQANRYKVYIPSLEPCTYKLDLQRIA